MADLMRVCKAGLAGCCSVLLIVIGIFVALIGLTLLAIGLVGGTDDYDYAANRNLAVAGGVMLSVGVVLNAIAICLCCYVCRKMQSHRGNTGTVLSTNPSQTTATVTTQYSPVLSQYPQHPQQQNPAQQPYPPQQQYPPQPQHQYPAEAQRYPAPQYPQYQVQQNQLSSAVPPPYSGYDRYELSPPTNPQYAHGGPSPSAPYPTTEKQAVAPSAPPHHQMSFKR